MKTFFGSEEFELEGGVLAHLEIRGDDHAAFLAVTADDGADLFSVEFSPGDALSMGLAFTRAGEYAQISAEHRTPARQMASQVPMAAQQPSPGQARVLRAARGAQPLPGPYGQQPWGGTQDDTQGSPQ
jgi:hypothetical protein